MPECVFCSIAAGDIPAHIVTDTADVVAFRDIDPKADTHVLIIPRRHYADIAELAAADPALTSAVITTAADVAREMGVSNGYRLIANTGAPAGQSVFHAHLHLLAGGRLPGF